MAPGFMSATLRTTLAALLCGLGFGLSTVVTLSWGTTPRGHRAPELERNQGPSAPFIHKYLPDNSLDKQDPGPLAANANGMTEELFFQLIEQTAARFCPVFEQYGMGCRIMGDWTSSIVNAYAMRFGGEWHAVVYGGLARRRELTPDGMVAVLCHEVGHHISGYAFKSFVIGDNWASTEGQADYFATHACLPELWRNETATNASFRGRIPQKAQQLCNEAWPEQPRRDLCYRIAAAALSDTTMIARAGGVRPDPRFETPSQVRVAETLEDHPTPQCRLDSQMAGALCPIPFDFVRIPGNDLEVSNRSPEAERDAFSLSCFEVHGHPRGARPRCWFAPQLGQ